METITLPERDFEFLLACLANQKFIRDVNADGLSMGVKKVKSIQQEMQDTIDKTYHKEMKRLINNKGTNYDCRPIHVGKVPDAQARKTKGK